MKFYRIDAAPFGKKWQRTQGEAKRVAREHGGTYEEVDLPTDHKSLTALFNQMQETAAGATPAPAQAPEAPEEPKTSGSSVAAHSGGDKDGKCPACKFDRRAGARRAQALADGMELDALVDRIERARAYPDLGRMAEAVASRFNDIVREAKSYEA